MKKIVKNSPFKFYCPKCDYGCCKKSHWNQHISTTKHKMITNDNKMITKKRHFCSCGKSYKFSSGLSRHLKVCPYSVEKSQSVSESVPPVNHALLLELKEMKEIMKKHGLGTVNNNNQTYNKITVNVFLNEHCKNAMNLTDFIKKLQLEAAKIPPPPPAGFGGCWPNSPPPPSFGGATGDDPEPNPEKAPIAGFGP